jgi:hypothetical protein
MISLLLTLLAVGVLLYLMLHHKSGPGDTGTDTGNAVQCEPLINRLVSSTGGIGPQAKAQYDQLPAECKRLMPDPASLAPTPQQPSSQNTDAQ